MSLESVASVDTSSKADVIARWQGNDSDEDDRPDSLFSRRADFWLLGGFSCVAWAIYITTTFILGRSPLSADSAYELFSFSHFVALAVFYPHFFWSYRIAYSRGWRFVRSNWIQLLFVPLTLIFVFSLSYLFLVSPETLPFMNSSEAGRVLISASVTLMMLTIGWHQAKQAFGCLVTYSHFDRYPLTSSDRRILLWLAYAFWSLNILNLHTGSSTWLEFFTIPFYRLGVPPTVSLAAIAFFWAFTAFVFYKVMYRIWRETKRLPSANFLIPIIALLLWWAPPFYQLEFYLLFSTSFHALQYWPFAMTYERRRRKNGMSRRSLFLLNFIGVALGGVTFFVLPLWSDAHLKPGSLREIAFFLVFVHVGLNIHHYFIDNVIWRSKQSEMKRYILGLKD